LHFSQVVSILDTSERKKTLACVAPGLSLDLMWKKTEQQQFPAGMSEESHFLEADCNTLRHVCKKMTDALERL